MNPKARAAKVIAVLRSLGVDCALVGGVAVSVRTRERFTKDLDFAVAVVSDQQAEQVTFGVQSNGFRLLKVIEHVGTGRLSTIRLAHPDDPIDSEPTVDLLFASSGIEPEIVADAALVPLAVDVLVPVARLAHLLALKVLSEAPERPQDRADLRALLACASESDLVEARALVALIHARGFARGRELGPALERFIEEFRRRRSS